MGQSHGFDNTVVFSKEATYGTAPTSNFYSFGYVESFEPEESNNIDSRMTIGSRAPIALRIGAKEVDASLSAALQNPRLFMYALGLTATTGDATAGYTHTITPVGKGQALPSFTAQNHNTELTFTRNYIGGKVDSFTVSASAEEAVMVEADFLFQKVTDSGLAVQTVTAETAPYYMFYESQVKIGGAAVANCSEFEVEVSNNLERKFNLNNANMPSRIEEGNLEITASLTLDLTDSNEWTKFRDGTALSVDLVLADPSNTKRKITISLTGGLYDSNSIAVGAEDLQSQELEAVFTGISIVALDPATSLI